MRMRRRHHYVPRFHLNRFADDGRIFVFDRQSGTTRRASVRDVALQKNLYRIDVPDMAPDALEIALSDIESAASRVLRDVEGKQQMPASADDLRTLLYYVAMQAVRIPQQRNNVDATLQDLFRMMSMQVAAHRYDEIREEIARTDPGHVDLPKEDLVRFIADPDSVDIKVAPELELMLMKDMADGVYEILLQRRWNVAVITPNKSNRFVTSDSPVLLYFYRKPPPGWSPGFGLNHTVVFFAVSPTVAIWSDTDSRIEDTIYMKNHMIRHMNWLTVMHCDRFVFSGREDVVVDDREHHKCSISEAWKYRN